MRIYTWITASGTLVWACKRPPPCCGCLPDPLVMQYQPGDNFVAFRGARSPIAHTLSAAVQFAFGGGK